jgi:dTDP-glucose 4,6-dehydratase
MGKTINVGSGREISIGELVKKIGTLLGQDIRIKNEKERSRPAKSEVERLVADNALARKILKWEPKVTLEEGLQRTIDWIRANLHEYRTNEYGT